jgi:hypothetical protein
MKEFRDDESTMVVVGVNNDGARMGPHENGV